MDASHHWRCVYPPGWLELPLGSTGGVTRPEAAEHQREASRCPLADSRTIQSPRQGCCDVTRCPGQQQAWHCLCLSLPSRPLSTPRARCVHWVCSDGAGPGGGGLGAALTNPHQKPRDSALLFDLSCLVSSLNTFPWWVASPSSAFGSCPLPSSSTFVAVVAAAVSVFQADTPLLTRGLQPIL